MALSLDLTQQWAAQRPIFIGKQPPYGATKTPNLAYRSCNFGIYNIAVFNDTGRMLMTCRNPAMKDRKQNHGWKRVQEFADAVTIAATPLVIQAVGACYLLSDILDKIAEGRGPVFWFNEIPLIAIEALLIANTASLVESIVGSLYHRKR